MWEEDKGGEMMERLTLKFPNGYLFKLPSAKDEIAQEKFANKLAEKLGEYEDFEEIFREKITDAACEFLKDKEEFGKWLDRKKWIAKKCDEYARAEEQGLLLRLPVKAGDTVYALRYGEENDFIIVETKIIEIRQNMNGIFFEPLISRKAYKTEDFGKDVFLTQAEAEQKLKEMENK